MEIYRHTTRADSAELATEKTFRPAPTEKWFGRVLLNKARPIRTILSFTIFEKIIFKGCEILELFNRIDQLNRNPIGHWKNFHLKVSQGGAYMIFFQ